MIVFILPLRWLANIASVHSATMMAGKDCQCPLCHYNSRQGLPVSTLPLWWQAKNDSCRNGSSLGNHPSVSPNHPATSSVQSITATNVYISYIYRTIARILLLALEAQAGRAVHLTRDPFPCTLVLNVASFTLLSLTLRSWIIPEMDRKSVKLIKHAQFFFPWVIFEVK